MVRTFVLLSILLAAAPAPPVLPPVASARGYWLQPVPDDDLEEAVRSAVTDPALAGTPGAARALRELAAEKDGASAALARLAAGLLHLDHQQYAEAEPLLLDPDMEKTRLEDHAWKALAELYEKTGNYAKSAEYFARIVGRTDPNPFRCTALVRGAEVHDVIGRREEAAELVQRALLECPGREPQALLVLGTVQQRRGDLKAAAAAFERLDRDYPATAQGREAVLRLGKLAGRVPAPTAEERFGHDLKKALVLFQAGENTAAARLFESLLARKPSADDAALIRIRLGRSRLELGRTAAARTMLSSVPRDSAVAPEAAYFLGRLQRSTSGVAGLAAMATRYPSTPWAEEALLDAAAFHARSGNDEQALPFYRRIYEGFPHGRYIDPATFRVGFAEYRAGRFDKTAEMFEAAAQARSSNLWRPAFLYWAGRARRELGQEDRARALFEDTFTRYKFAYHGIRAREALGRLPAGSSSTHPAPAEGLEEVPEPYRTRARNLLLIERLAEAMDELSAAPVTPAVQATRSWIFWRQGQLRPAITAMKRAYPEHVTESGATLPDAVWRIMYPLAYDDLLVQNAASVGLDPALVAAVIQQESTFDPRAVSSAGAHGLMQLLPSTGRGLARQAGMKSLRVAQLHDPAVGLKLGTRYLREMIDRFGGKVERALAAYNAGPSRVSVWNRARPDLSPEEFVDSIPFSETRTYVMVILAGREQYRRIYGMPAPSAGGTTSAGPSP